MPIATLLDGTTIEYEAEELARGGMKAVHYTSDRKNVICFYYRNINNIQNRLNRLQAILEKYNLTINPTQDNYLANYYRQRFCWPTAIVTEPQLGIVTPVYSENYFFPLEILNGKEKSLGRFVTRKTRERLQKELGFLNKHEELGFFNKHIEICIHLARAVRGLHTKGLAHSDLSDKNVLIDPVTGKSLIIDVDSLVIPGTIFTPDVGGTRGYQAPEIIRDSNNHPCIYTDLHSLGVIIYQILLGRHPLEGPKIHPEGIGKTGEEQERIEMGISPLYIEHPKDHSNRPDDLRFESEKILGNSLSELFKIVFIEGLNEPKKRPIAAKWEQELLIVNENLIPCTNEACSYKWFVYRSFEKTQTCPFCGHSRQGTTAGVKLKIDSNEKNLAIYDNRPLFKYHFQGTGAFLEENEIQLANFKLISGKWYLKINTDLISLYSSQKGDGQETSIQSQPILLEDSIELIFDQNFQRKIRIEIPNPNRKIEIPIEPPQPKRPKKEDKINITTTSEKVQKLNSRRQKKNEDYEIDLGNGVTIEFVHIPGGGFMMGGNQNNNEQPPHQVTIEPFLMAKTPITQAQWTAVAKLPKKNADLDLVPSHFKDKLRPVECVTWDECQEFCTRLGGKIVKTCRLPSEAEWEYACRSATTTQFFFGNDQLSLKKYAWYKDNSQNETHRVNFKKNLNHWKLSDMHGNVWEWCQDDWHDNYSNAPNDGSPWLRTEKDYALKLLRGGSWQSPSENCTTSYRRCISRSFAASYVGFRVVIDLKNES